jgi:hypothetical protein
MSKRVLEGMNYRSSNFKSQSQRSVVTKSSSVGGVRLHNFDSLVFMNERPLSNSLPRLFLSWIVEWKFKDVQARLVDVILRGEVAEVEGGGWERWR